MNISRIVSEGSFNSIGLNDDNNKIITPSKLLITKQQQNRIKERNKIATNKHIENKKNKNENNNNNSDNLNKSYNKLNNSNNNNNLLSTGQNKLRNMKQKELAVKLEYMKKLQQKEEENATILSITKTLLKHNQTTLQQERKKAINLLSKIETVLRFETEQSNQEQTQQTQQQQQSLKQNIPTPTATPKKGNNQSSSSSFNNNNNNNSNSNNKIPFERNLKLSNPIKNEIKHEIIISDDKPSSFVPLIESNRVLPLKNKFIDSNINLKEVHELNEPIIPIKISEQIQLKSVDIPKNTQINQESQSLVSLIPISRTRSGNNVPFSNQPSLEEIDIDLIEIIENEQEDENEDDEDEKEKVKDDEKYIIDNNKNNVDNNNLKSLAPQIKQENSASTTKLSVTSKIWGMAGNIENDDDEEEVSETEWDD